jgi:L-aminopeptidase/D-esterase-like protein
VSADFSSLALAVGHATDPDGATGCTVVRGIDGPLRGAAAIAGRATGTREMHPLGPHHLVDRIDAILLTGGSAYGLDAAAGVMRWMEERGRGFPVGAGVVPIVPAAVVFDLAPLGRFDARPTPAMAYDACDRAAPREIEEGSVGAGTGATVGKVAGAGRAMKGGIGCATASGRGLVAGALAVVNAFGDVRDGDGRILAGARSASGGFVDAAAMLADGGAGSAAGPGDAPARFANASFRNTTLAVVAVSAPLSRVELSQLARAATAALYRRITPTGTSVDGDVVFAVAPATGAPASPMQAEALAVAALEMAVERAVRLARGREGIPGLADDAPAPAPARDHAAADRSGR